MYSHMQRGSSSKAPCSDGCSNSILSHGCWECWCDVGHRVACTIMPSRVVFGLYPACPKSTARQPCVPLGPHACKPRCAVPPLLQATYRICASSSSLALICREAWVRPGQGLRMAKQVSSSKGCPH